MASEDVQTNLRLPADLKDRLQASAAENGRSLSAEVAIRLRDSFDLAEESHRAYNSTLTDLAGTTGHILVGSSASEMRARHLAAEGQAIAQDAAVVGLRQQLLVLRSKSLPAGSRERAQLEEDINSLSSSILKIEANSKALRTLAESFKRKADALEFGAMEESPQIGIPNFLLKNAKPKP